ncbi:MAG TPA: transcription antitermination factor NusB [Kiritimatiellia bacterium]|mgnify:CR=1 FL=1|nr:transcription antitermination factor NusB [Kiritimatiellia bacterium]HMO97961.1 transcription antitermination factor NusB [Kiritimatiellia bacterium]HMP95312.1 transcription antitermination factor NusB [Kiritimatiellia bacterium]
MNAGRHESRMWAVQFLFQRDFNRGDVGEALEEFWLERKSGPALRQFAEELIHGVEAHKTELDADIQRYAEHWNVARMGAVDRNVMRVALYEMLHRPDIPPVVSINEAVELAKEFSGDESGKFVNGILDRASKDVKRPARTGRPGNAPSTWGEREA